MDEVDAVVFRARRVQTLIDEALEELKELENKYYNLELQPDI
jgi:hypothetical protein